MTRTHGQDHLRTLLFPSVRSSESVGSCCPRGSLKSGSVSRIRYLPTAVPMTLSRFARWTWYWSRASSRSRSERDAKSVVRMNREVRMTASEPGLRSACPCFVNVVEIDFERKGFSTGPERQSRGRFSARPASAARGVTDDVPQHDHAEGYSEYPSDDIAHQAPSI
jgi:hypothetical protein